MSTSPHPVLARIHEADRLIIAEAFDSLMDHYTQDAVLILKPGLEVRGHHAIRGAMEKIADFFAHGLRVTQEDMLVLEAGDTALVLAKTLITAPGRDDERRRATYIYRLEADAQWRCCIDNSYGHRLLEEGRDS
jgi:ketosteroid isomerase-like protein